MVGFWGAAELKGTGGVQGRSYNPPVNAIPAANDAFKVENTQKMAKSRAFKV